MARHLRPGDIEVIVRLLDGWKEPLTWSDLCDACLRAVGMKPSRQTLAKNMVVKSAFDTAKERIRKGVDLPAAPSSLKVAAERISRLEVEVKRLQELNRRLYQRFIVWQYNAYARGMTDRELDRELPAIDREPSDHM